jgi:hypothetical protein
MVELGNNCATVRRARELAKGMGLPQGEVICSFASVCGDGAMCPIASGPELQSLEPLGPSRVDRFNQRAARATTISA